MAEVGRVEPARSDLGERNRSVGHLVLRIVRAVDVVRCLGVGGGRDVLSALVGACCAVQPHDPFGAAWAALLLFHAAVRHSTTEPPGPGGFWVRFNDALAELQAADVQAASVAETR